MTIDHRKQVEAAVAATQIQARLRYAWFGKPSRPPAAHLRRALAPEAARAYLRSQLQAHLYEAFYTRGGAEPEGRPAAPGFARGSTEFVAALSAANSGRGFWADGWDVRAVERGGLVVAGNGLSVSVRVGAHVAAEASPRVGDRVAVRSPKELPGVSPGFFMVLGEAPLAEDEPLVRLYWHLTPEGAAVLVREVTTALNDGHVPFRLKVLNDPSRYTRCDAGVVYLRQDDYPQAIERLGQAWPAIAPYLRPRTPAFTKPLAPGLGLAEDPGGGTSFGLHRCALLAEGLIAAHEARQPGARARLAAVEARFAAAGIDLERPYLNPGSQDRYQFEPRGPTHRRTALQAAAPTEAEVAPARYLDAAGAIGRQLVRTAIWHDGRCNWLGLVPKLAVDSVGGQADMVYGALGADLYAGTSGIAWFLAELAAITGDAAARQTARGAIGQALAAAALPAGEELWGLHTGWLGTAVVAARMGIVLRDAALLAQAAALAAPAVDQPARLDGFDLLYGKAGAIAGLILLHAMLDDPSLLDTASRLGDALLATAESDAAGTSWRSSHQPGPHNWTGMSHGTAGAAYALLELHHATGMARYRQVAEQAFTYERHWFDAEALNWADFREKLSPRRSVRPPFHAAYWCHGAAGITLSRLRAYTLLGDATCRAEALVGLRTTRRAVHAALPLASTNYSLCHGLAGQAEVLRAGSQDLDAAASDAAALADQVAATGLRQHGLDPATWPCGTMSGGQTPGLMLGLAGIGHFYLRLYSPRVPSALLPVPEEFCGGAA
jgi:hypothetical protein